MDQPSEPLASASSALRLVTVLGERGRIRVTEAARELGVAPSTAHRLLAVLCRWNFAIQDEDRSYVQGPAFLRFSLANSTSETLRLMVQSQMRRLAATVGDTTHLVVLEGVSVRFINSAEGPGALRVASRVGVLLPAHCTSGGKALLADLEEGALRERYADGLPEAPGSSIHTIDALLDELATVRERRFAINIDESEPGISAIGVALHHRSGSPVAGLSISAPSMRFRQDRIPELVEAIQGAARQIEDAM